MKKIVLGLSLTILVGCGDEAISNETISVASIDDSQYAKDRAYSSGMLYASETLSDFKGRDLDIKMGIAIARTLTEKNKDIVLKSKFQKGYEKAKASIDELKAINKTDISSTEKIANESIMGLQGSRCERKIETPQSTYQRMAKLTDSDLQEHWVSDLSVWLTNS